MSLDGIQRRDERAGERPQRGARIDELIEVLMHLALNAENEMLRVLAARAVIDIAHGKPPRGVVGLRPDRDDRRSHIVA